MLPRLKSYSTLDLSHAPLNEIHPERLLEQIAPEGRVVFERVIMTKRQISELKLHLKKTVSDKGVVTEPQAFGNMPAHRTHPAYEQPPSGAVGSVAGAWLVEKYV